jgi:hypothetical protein
MPSHPTQVRAAKPPPWTTRADILGVRRRRPVRDDQPRPDLALRRGSETVSDTWPRPVAHPPAARSTLTKSFRRRCPRPNTLRPDHSALASSRASGKRESPPPPRDSSGEARPPLRSGLESPSYPGSCASTGRNRLSAPAGRPKHGLLGCSRRPHGQGRALGRQRGLTDPAARSRCSRPARAPGVRGPRSRSPGRLSSDRRGPSSTAHDLTPLCTHDSLLLRARATLVTRSRKVLVLFSAPSLQ